MCAYEYKNVDATGQKGSAPDGVEHQAVVQTPASLKDEFPGLAQAVEALASLHTHNVPGSASLKALKEAFAAIEIVRQAWVHYGSVQSDADLNASWQYLQHVISCLRVNGVSTHFLVRLLSDLLTVQSGGTPTSLLRPRKVGARQSQHLRRDLVRGYLAAVMDYVQSTGLIRKSACAWVSEHVPTDIAASIGASASVIDDWHVQFGSGPSAAGGAGTFAYALLRDWLEHVKPDREQLVIHIQSLFTEAPAQGRCGAAMSGDAVRQGPLSIEDAQRFDAWMADLRSAIEAIEADPLKDWPDATQDDIPIVATIRVLTKIIGTLRELGLATSALTDINLELLNLWHGGKPSPILRPRHGPGRPKAHLDRDIASANLAAIMDYQRRARGWSAERASAWVSKHLPRRSGFSLGLKAIQKAHARWSRDTGRDEDVAGRVGFLNQSDRLEHGRPSSIQIVAWMKSRFRADAKPRPG